MTVRPTRRDTTIATGATAVVVLGETALLTAIGGRLARRMARQFGTPYAPLSRRDAFVTAYMIRYVSRLLRAKGSPITPQRIAEERQEQTNEALRQRLVRRGEQIVEEGGRRRAERDSSIGPRWDFTTTSEPEPEGDPVDLMEQMREGREEARQGRRR